MTAYEKYKTPASFREAWSTRQKERAKRQGVPVNRLAQLDLYFRFLERVVHELGDGVVVIKGGVALEMRLQRARTTLDIDLRASGTPEDVYKQIRRAGLRDHGDYLSFEVTEAISELEDALYGGHRFRVQAKMAGRTFLNPFPLDVAFGDAMLGGPDYITAPDALSFVGIAPPTIPVYPLGSHLAEKLHAYTRSRAIGENSRLKDLIDLALVAQESALKPSPIIMGSTLSAAIKQTFAARNTHEQPASLPPFPESWRARYDHERTTNGYPWPSIDHVHAAAAKFIDPVLANEPVGSWDPIGARWDVIAAEVDAT